ncbi:MAG: cytochrome c oxidase subunit II [Alphaproteobacteria bacterium]|nr:cytochrome c oxidase subunit II [Alphaproteobacteria bacterium]
MTGWPLSYLQSAGPAASPVARLAWGLGSVSVAVVLIVGVGLIAAIWRRRPSADDPMSLVPGASSASGIGWIYVGLAISVPVLAICTIWTLAVLGKVMHPASAPHLRLQVTAHQWWWEVRYPTSNSQQTFTTANEIHIPAGEPVEIVLNSADVIHSFWVPKLGGKMDVIPGITNRTWIEASDPGRFRGQCAEFCGAQHAHMAFYVVAQPRAEFDAWVADQLAFPAKGASPSQVVASGERVFSARCAACHTVSGTPAGGIVGPNLGHFASRSTLAAGSIPNDADHLRKWIADPQAIKPGVRMPAVPLTTADRDAVVAYLESLT